MGMKKAHKHRNPTLPKQTGEIARLKVVKGPDQGHVYVLNASPVTIGRGEENDVLLLDLKTSRLHAELRQDGAAWTVADLGSANGILVNGAATRRAAVKDGDVVTVGETVMEFMSGAAGTRLLTAPPKTAEQVHHDRAMTVAQEQRLKAMTTPGGMSQFQAQMQSRLAAFGGVAAGGRNRMILFVAAAGVLAWLYMSDSKSVRQRPQGEGGAASRNLASYLPNARINSEARRSAEVFYKTGFREFRERNFLRAKTAFETALQIDPTHALSRLYLENCDIEIKAEVAMLGEQGAKLMAAGRYREAKGKFQSVQRLLFKDQTNPAFIEATQQVEDLRKKIKSGVGDEDEGADSTAQGGSSG